MLEKLLHKKQYLLLASAILLLLVSYQLAFKPTLTAWQLNHHLKQQLAQQTDLSYQPGYKERKNANLERIIRLYSADTLDLRSKVLGNISTVAEKEGVKLSEVPANGFSHLEGSVITQRLNFDGNYAGLAKMLNDLQHARGIGVIRSVTFHAPKGIAAEEKSKNILLECYFEIIYK